ncbi:hypothetical protein Tco_0280834 [Tanacetum coccineum]
MRISPSIICPDFGIPHQDKLEKQESDEAFPLKILGSIASSRSKYPMVCRFCKLTCGEIRYPGNGHPNKRNNKYFRDVKHYFWDDPFLLKTMLTKWNYLGNTIGANYNSTEKILSIQDLLVPPSTRMPTTLSPVVIFVNVKEKLRNVMRCHKTPSKFAKSLTSGAWFLYGAFLVFRGYKLKIFSGKLKSRWSGPFTIVQVFPYGTVELSQNSGPNFKVNGHRIKHYFGGDIPTVDFRFVKYSQVSSEFYILSFFLGIQYPKLID